MARRVASLASRHEGVYASLLAHWQRRVAGRSWTRERLGYARYIGPLEAGGPVELPAFLLRPHVDFSVLLDPGVKYRVHPDDRIVLMRPVWDGQSSPMRSIVRYDETVV